MVEKEYYENRYAEEGAGEEEVLSRPAWAREMPYWTVSAALHIFLVLIIGGLIFSQEITRPQKRKPLVAKTIAPPPKFDPKKKRDLKRVPQILCPRSSVYAGQRRPTFYPLSWSMYFLSSLSVCAPISGLN